ncbi:Histidine--tRNA ligase [Candidatus Tiddalikarchaeum anstoanum]|nr:Histidine--tRNA ligase [Candidatus Tiddalikarchaeum anstoanum]
MTNLQPYIGTRDFLPSDWDKELFIANKWRSSSKMMGFEEYDAPTIEEVSLFTRKSGEEIKSQLFYFKDRGDREVCLRPELTPQLARFVIMYGKGLKKPLKWFSIPRCFRYERPQKGRLREFFQYNADIIGEVSVLATVEILNLAISTLESFGLKSNDIVVRVNSRVLIDSFVKRFGVEDKSAFYLLLDKKLKITPKEFDDGLRNLVKEYDLAKRLFSLTDKELIVELDSLGFDVSRLKTVVELCNPEYLEVDLSIVRGLDYYTDIVFEAYDRGGKFRAIFGGGEYNNLVSDFGGEKTPAVGFAEGDAVLFEVLKDKKLLPDYLNNSVFIATVGNVMTEALKLRNFLLKKGVSCDINMSERNLSKQFEYAENRGIHKVYIIGEKDLEKDTITVKDLVSGKEEKVKLSKFS